MAPRREHVTDGYVRGGWRDVDYVVSVVNFEALNYDIRGRKIDTVWWVVALTCVFIGIMVSGK